MMAGLGLEPHGSLTGRVADEEQCHETGLGKSP